MPEEARLHNVCESIYAHCSSSSLNIEIFTTASTLWKYFSCIY